jgi:ankyrin repeat protein
LALSFAGQDPSSIIIIIMMNVKRRSLPTLQIPDNSRSPAGNSPTAQTGRPPLWTRSAQRKMSRLYLYTTLPITKILELIYSGSPHSAPGKDSANKKLNAMLDKEPRWLHPKTNADMGRRVSQLPNSPMRLSMNDNAPSDWPHPSDSSPPFGFGPVPSLNQSHNHTHTHSRPSTRHASPADFWSTSAPASATSGQGYMPPLPAFADNDAHSSRGDSASPGNDLAPEQSELLEDFIRRTTCLSSSTDQTTGTYRRVLGDSYPDVYIKTVRRLVKRFTLPNNNNNNRTNDNRRSVSPISERAEQPQTSWLDDEDAPSVFNDRPYPLPGDFLRMDPATRAGYEVPDSPWMTSIAPTSDAHRLLSGGIMPTDVHARDTSGNTVMHFLAMHGSVDLALHALSTGYCTPILDVQNTAGQTFLHLVTWQWLKDFDHLQYLTRVLRELGFNFYLRDNYGRNFFHVLLLETPEANSILQSFDQRHYAKRDAFNRVPRLVAPSGDQMDIDSQGRDGSFQLNTELSAVPEFSNDSRLLRYVRHASEYPWLEDDDGRNGLHCLAMVSLSVSQVSSRIGGVSLVPAVPEGGRRRSHSNVVGVLDSSEDRLALRHSQLLTLLRAGVDPNQYDLQGHTPLMVFAAELPEDDDYKTGPKILEALLDGGADIHARSRAGETALHIAVRCGRKLAMRTLVRRGANVFARDAAGRSVLDVADIKMASLSDDDPVAYAHYEACRAWLSGPGLAVQRPSARQEWSVRP